MKRLNLNSNHYSDVSQTPSENSRLNNYGSASQNSKSSAKTSLPIGDLHYFFGVCTFAYMVFLWRSILFWS